MECDRESGLQVNDVVPGEQVPRARVEHRARAEPEHAGMLTKRRSHRFALQRTKRRFAVLYEDVTDRFTRDSLDVGVGVAEPKTELTRENPADGRLPRAWRANEHGDGPSHAISSDDRYPRRLRLVSSSESPPNFSRAASASTRATIDSATTPAAGTAVTSLR